MIELQHVSKHYKNTRAVDDISLVVNEGETVVLLGTSGCGKTTTLRMVNRLTEPTHGNILVNGKNIMTQPQESLRRGIGYVLQHTGLFPHYTIAENIAIVPNLLTWDEQKIHQRTNELLEKLQLDPSVYAGQYPEQLSGGQQQRVGLARALAANPPVLLMDEPFGALDPVTRAGIRKEFKQLDELKRKTILMVTHDVQEAFELGDKICLMDKGKIVQAGKPSELLMNPANEFVDAFLKDQRLQLELQTITINHIWNQLNDFKSLDQATIIDAGDNLWNALEILSSAKDPATESFFSLREDQQKKLTIPAIMTAFANFKSRQSNG
jgi:osmoprotectant transport system ATP-binding protein